MTSRANLLSPSDGPPVEVVNPEGSSDVVLVCEHAANRIPAALGTLGLGKAQRLTHIAWDPGAAPMARHIGAAMDAPLVMARFSRLVYDCNRPPTAPSAMPRRSEAHVVPGNADLCEAERRARVAEIYLPFRRRLSDLLDERRAAGRRSVLVTVHSFTPVYAGIAREVDLGILHDTDSRLADEMIRIEEQRGDLVVRRNAPYGPQDGVTHTLAEHALARGLLNVMLEIRNDLIEDARSQELMAARLSRLIGAALVPWGYANV